MIVVPYNGELYLTILKQYITIHNNFQLSLWPLDNKFQISILNNHVMR